MTTAVEKGYVFVKLDELEPRRSSHPGRRKTRGSASTSAAA